MSNTVRLTELRIGRNYNEGPFSIDGDGTTLSDQAWESFKTMTRDALHVFAVQIEADTFWIETHTGTGTWTGDDGVTHTEESAVVTLYWTENGLNGPSRTRYAYRRLYDTAGIIAFTFNQDAVAVIRDGRSILVSKEGVVK
jgi:hypothetical protein